MNENISINIEAATAAPTAAQPIGISVACLLVDQVVAQPAVAQVAAQPAVAQPIVLPPLAKDDELTHKELIKKQADDAIHDSSKIEGSHIMSMTEKYFPDLLKVLTLCSKDMSSENSVLAIRNGVIIIEKTNNGVLTADISSIFGKANWNIISPQKTLRLISMLSKCDSITLLDDSVINQYIIFNQTKGKIGRTMRLPKIDEESSLPDVKAIDRTSPNVKLMHTYEIKSADVADLSKAMDIAKTIDSQKALTFVELVEDTFELISIAISDLLIIEINDNIGNKPTIIVKADDLFSVSNPDADTQVTLKIYDNLVGLNKKDVPEQMSEILFDSITNIASTSIKLSTTGSIQKEFVANFMS